MKKIVIAVLAAISFVSCGYVDIPTVQLEELGVYANDYEVDYSEDILDIDIISSGPSTITKISGCDWLDLSSEKFSGDYRLKVAYEQNEGFPRKAVLLVSLDANPEYSRDTIVIRQRGFVQPYLTLPQSGLVIYNDTETSYDVEVSTNIPKEQITIKKRILDGNEDWISELRWNDEGKLVLGTVDNTAELKRTAVVSFVYDNGWGESNVVNLRLTQLGSNNELGVQNTFEQVREAAGQVLADDIYIDAYVVSDVNSGNVNENPMLSSLSIDYDVCRRSVYLQSLDGNYGFLGLTSTEDDNVFEVDTKVRISLGGVAVKKYTAPDRYVLDGIKAASLLSAEAAVIPEKEKYMSQLTDNDIYTRVTLKDVEWPIRKGSLSPCFERMTNAADVDAATKFATLLRDKEGSSLYILTNTTCYYRRDGSRMPYGSGDMRGIIVHEKHRPFVDEDAALEDDCGNIGRYQIRHMSRSDFRMASDFTDSFSDMICEFRYINGYEDGKMQATYGQGTMTHTYDNGYSIYPYYDFSYLGPVGTEDEYFFGKNFGNVNGFGIITEEGVDYGLDFSANIDMYSAGRTYRDKETLSWSAYYWWNSDTDTPYYWVAEFSTAGITTDVISLQLSMLNQCQISGKNAPRYWKIEWGAADGDEQISVWNTVGEFALPDITPTSAPLLLSMSSAFKPRDFKINDSNILGHEKVAVRIGPSVNNAGQALGKPVYQGNKISSNATGAGSMTYFAVRYNK